MLTKTRPAGRSRVGPLNLRQIEVFHAIMVTGSISDAGRMLCVSQPAVSRVLASAELRLQFLLFERVRGRLQPTPEAQRLFAEVEAIHEGVDRLNTMAVEMAEGQRGDLKIVSGPSFSEWLMPRAITRFHGDHPKVHIKYRPLPLDALLPHLTQGQADIAISSWPSPDGAKLISRQIGEGTVVCAIPRKHRLAALDVITPGDLVGQTFIGYGRDTPFGRSMIDFLSLPDGEMTPDIEVRSAPDAAALVRQGVGVALIDSYGIAQSALDDVVLRPIEPAVPNRVYLVHSRETPLSTLAKSFLGVLRSVMKKDGASMSA